MRLKSIKVRTGKRRKKNTEKLESSTEKRKYFLERLKSYHRRK